MAAIKPNEAYTPEFTGAYAQFLIDGQENERGDLVYSIRAVFDEFDGWDPKDSSSIPAWAKDAVKAAIATGKDKKWSGSVPRALELPFRDGDMKEQDEFHGKMFVNAKSYKKRCPIIGPDGKALMQIDQDTIYSGAKYRALVSFAPFLHKGKAGVGVYLTAIQKTGEGQRTDGGMSESQAENLFGATGDTTGGANPSEDDWLN